jgi:4a-hydroxytetrahydrobiopterin dehydratase
MSDQGWQDFLAAENVGDWVVLHGGAMAVFSVLSLGDAARLADAGGRIVHHWNAPEAWTLADRAGNRVCFCAWPDGATGSGVTTPEPR